MSPSSQRITIAKACGWTEVTEADNLGIGGYKKRRANNSGWLICLENQLPDYLSDLNAMHEAEHFINNHITYWNWLCRLAKQEARILTETELRTRAARSSASQRAEAFLRTLNLWTEE